VDVGPQHALHRSCDDGLIEARAALSGLLPQAADQQLQQMPQHQRQMQLALARPRRSEASADTGRRWQPTCTCWHQLLLQHETILGCDMHQFEHVLLLKCWATYIALSRRLTNRWEASLWLNGRQLYLGGFNSEADAARAYDIVALSCKGLHVATNFSGTTYTTELAELAGSTQVWLRPVDDHTCYL
jgi:hypothetical protein